MKRRREAMMRRLSNNRRTIFRFVTTGELAVLLRLDEHHRLQIPMTKMRCLRLSSKAKDRAGEPGTRRLPSTVDTFTSLVVPVALITW